MLVVWLLLLVSVVLPLLLLTAAGAHSRGASVGLAVLAGALFPVTWVVWYVRDVHPYREAIRHAHLT